MNIAGSFNIKDYLNRLYEENEAKAETVKSSTEGLIIPEENKKSFSWLKKEYERGKTEVKVEINMGGSNFKPSMDLQTNLKSVKDFKPGMFGDVKTSDTEGSKKIENESSEGDKNGQKPAEGKGFSKFGNKEGNKEGTDKKEGEKGKPIIKGEVKKAVSIKDGKASEEKDNKKEDFKKKFNK